MNSVELIIVICLSVITGIIYCVIGYFLVIKQKQDLINGVDFSTLSDPKGFMRVLGRSFLNSGGTIFVCALVVYRELIGLLVFTLLFSIACCLPMLTFVKAKKQYSS